MGSTKGPVRVGGPPLGSVSQGGGMEFRAVARIAHEVARETGWRWATWLLPGRPGGDGASRGHQWGAGRAGRGGLPGQELPPQAPLLAPVQCRGDRLQLCKLDGVA